MIRLKSVKEAKLDGRRVLMRLDLNVPVKDGKVDDDERIVQSVPTLKYVIENGGIPLIMAHLGRPKGERNDKYSLAPVRARLSELIGKEVTLLDDVRGAKTMKAVKASKKGDVLLFENIRFEKEEEKNAEGLSALLAGFADVYVNDAFGCTHRNHASTEGVTRCIGECYAGFLLEKEISVLSSLRKNAEKPFVAITGGSKVSSKISVLESFLGIADTIVIVGAMAYTFLRAQGVEVGKSMVEEDYVPVAESFLAKAKELGRKVVLPVDHICASEFSEGAEAVAVEGAAIPSGMMGMDIGPETLKKIKSVLSKAKTVFWNGPAGVFEFPQFAAGTNGIAECIAHLKGAKTVVGGGDSVSAVKKSGFASSIYHISTGGGASLEFLEGRAFDTLAPLMERKDRRKLLAGNWKMNMTKEQALSMCEALKKNVVTQDVDVAVAPTFPLLESVSASLKGSGMGVFAQNMSNFDKGAYTGEVSAEILASIGVKKVIIGHSERRGIFRESCGTIAAKVKKAIDNSFDVILCVGESDKVRESGEWKEFLSRQFRNSVKGLRPVDAVRHLTVAYEPVWAIGTGKNADSAIAEETAAFVRGLIASRFGKTAADRVRVLYGGSVKPENVAEYVSQENIDGVLVGGASLVEEKFVSMAKSCGNL